MTAPADTSLAIRKHLVIREQTQSLSAALATSTAGASRTGRSGLGNREGSGEQDLFRSQAPDISHRGSALRAEIAIMINPIAAARNRGRPAQTHRLPGSNLTAIDKNPGLA